MTRKTVPGEVIELVNRGRAALGLRALKQMPKGIRWLPCRNSLARALRCGVAPSESYRLDSCKPRLSGHLVDWHFLEFDFRQAAEAVALAQALGVGRPRLFGPDCFRLWWVTLPPVLNRFIMDHDRGVYGELSREPGPREADYGV